MQLFFANSIGNYIDSACQYTCWIFAFSAGGRLLWLSIFWLLMESFTRLIAYKNESVEVNSATAQVKDYGSWWLFVYASLLMTSVVLFIFHNRLMPNLPSSFIIGGMLLMICGIALRIWAVVSLGKFFTMKVMILSNHQLVKIGPYRWLRHPSYTGIFITTLGLGLAAGYLIVLITFVAIISMALGYRIYVEEKALSEEFGLEWEVYSAKTWKILPWIF